MYSIQTSLNMHLGPGGGGRAGQRGGGQPSSGRGWGRPLGQCQGGQRVLEADLLLLPVPGAGGRTGQALGRGLEAELVRQQPDRGLLQPRPSLLLDGVQLRPSCS